MFARTERLLLRPGWAEDAPALAAAIGDEAIVRNLREAPWPYRPSDAEALLAQPCDPAHPAALIFARTLGAPRLVGGIGLRPLPCGGLDLGYWIARRHWGLGYATEASRAVVAFARAILPARRLVADHFTDNPASGNVLRKLGFRPTGRIVPRVSAARKGAAACVGYALDLAEDAPVRAMAA
jgi:RimJ/RimL family protein N-acetyltransferase